MRLFIRGSAVLAVLVGLLMVVLPTLAATSWAGIDWDGEYVEPTASLTVEADGSLHVVTTGPDDDAHLWDAFSAPRSETWVGGTFRLNTDVGSGSHQQVVALAGSAGANPAAIFAWRSRSGSYTNRLFVWHHSTWVDTGVQLAAGAAHCIEFHLSTTEVGLHVDGATVFSVPAAFPAVTHLRLGANGAAITSDWSASPDFYVGGAQVGCGGSTPVPTPTPTATPTPTPTPPATPPLASLVSVAGDLAAPYEDLADDGITEIIVGGEAGMDCRWYATDVAYDAASGTPGITNGTQATLIVAPTGVGAYAVFVACANSSGVGQSAAQNLDVAWTGIFSDGTPPVLFNGAPNGELAAGTLSTTLSLATDESAFCKYSAVPGIAFASMVDAFTTTGGVSHSSPVTGLSDGTSYSFYARCEDAAGNANINDYLISFSVGSALPSIFTARVGTGNDDAEENVARGSIGLTSSDLEFMSDKGSLQLAGMRWQGVSVPQGASILRAYIELTTDETGSAATDLQLRGEAVGDAAAFTNTTFDISSRTSTTSVVAWTNVVPWLAVGQTHQTPNIASLVQEIVDRPDWATGNAMVIIAAPVGSNNGPRTAESYNGVPASAPLLYIEYSLSDTIPPSASIAIAGGAATVPSTVVSLDLNCTDDRAVQDVRYSNDGVFDTEPYEGLSSIKLWTLSPGDGIKTVYFECRDTSGNVSVASDSVLLDATPPSTVLVSVAGDTTAPYEDAADDGNTLIVVEGEAGMECRWYGGDVAYSDSSGIVGITTGTLATLTVAPTGVGTYTVYVACVDATGAGQSAMQNLAATWTSNFPAVTPPVRSNGAPSGELAAGTLSTTLSLTTNELATCKFSVVPGVAFGRMTGIFSATGGVTHSVTVSGLSDGTSYPFYIRCEDVSGNANPDDYVISFSVASPAPPPPSAANLYGVHMSTTSGQLANEATLTWFTSSTSIDQRAQLGTTAGVYSVNLTATQHNYTGYCCVQTVVASNLHAGTDYFYRVGSSTDGWSAEYHFKTAPAKGSRLPFTFGALGDHATTSHSGDVSASVQADLMIHMGDIFYCNTQACVDSYFTDTIGDVASQIAWMPALGNHELSQPDDRITPLGRFSLPGRPAHQTCPIVGGRCDRTETAEMWYSFDYDNVHFVAYDGNHFNSSSANGIGPGEPRYEWLKADLAAAAIDPSIDWVVVYGHFSPYANGKDIGHASNDRIRTALEPLITQYADLHLGGHQHSYQRTLPVAANGTLVDTVSCGAAPYATCTSPAYPIYLVNGAGGDSLYLDASVCGTPANCALWEGNIVTGSYGHIEVSVDGATITVRFLDPSRAVLDEVVITK